MNRSKGKYISPEKFAAIPPEEQDRLMREYAEDLSVEERKILKKMIENENAALP